MILWFTPVGVCYGDKIENAIRRRCPLEPGEIAYMVLDAGLPHGSVLPSPLGGPDCESYLASTQGNLQRGRNSGPRSIRFLGSAFNRSPAETQISIGWAGLIICKRGEVRLFPLTLRFLGSAPADLAIRRKPAKAKLHGRFWRPDRESNSGARICRPGRFKAFQWLSCRTGRIRPQAVQWVTALLQTHSRSFSALVRGGWQGLGPCRWPGCAEAPHFTVCDIRGRPRPRVRETAPVI